MRVLLIAGGWSPEREVSLSGARGIRKAIEELGHEPVDYDPLTDGLDALPEAARSCGFAFLNLHGAPGEDGLIQAMLDVVGCPYQGADPAGSFLALNKTAAKVLFRDAGLPTPDWEFLPTPPPASWTPRLAYPLFVKPNNGGSSLGMSLVREPGELGPALDAIFSGGGEALVEPCLEGVEITCGVLGDEALPPIMIRPKDGAAFFDYDSKYVAGKCDEICPAPLDEAATARVQEISLAAHRALGLAGYSRSDFILADDGPWLLEVNTLPGMTATSLVPQEAQAVGMDFAALIGRLMELGLAQQRRRP
ncbi:D-alanine--D-alanine ligase family protein [Desulfocurvus sp. DL9XJH121]